ncbi:MAG TPA: hypothetical protein V6C52_02030 [Coleofasciculaceae cyanobacterium]|jgi:hypothetical protein
MPVNLLREPRPIPDTLYFSGKGRTSTLKTGNLMEQSLDPLALRTLGREFGMAVEKLKALGTSGTGPKQAEVINTLIKNLTHAPNKFPEILIECIRYATEAHKNQLYGGRYPFNCHILSVAMYTVEQDGTLGEIMAALMHDITEDQGGAARLKDVIMHFDKKVADVVDGCSYQPVPKAQFSSPIEKVILEQLAMLRYLQTAPRSVRKVKAADIKHNTISSLEERRQGKVKSFELGPMGELWKRLSRVAVLKKARQAHGEEEDAFLNQLEQDVLQLIESRGVGVDAVRNFNPWSLVPREHFGWREVALVPTCPR